MKSQKQHWKYSELVSVLYVVAATSDARRPGVGHTDGRHP